jgi:murein DD-endopeptidase MepM/ murein hydrolase activator NlpD
MSLKVIKAEGGTIVLPGNVTEIKLDLSRPGIVSAATTASIAKLDNASASVMVNKVSHALRLMPKFATDPEGLGYLIGTSISAPLMNVSPPQARAHLLTLITLESGLNKYADNPRSSAFGYLQLMPASRTRFLDEGTKRKDLLIPYVTAATPQELRTAALVAVGMWDVYIAHINEFWRYSPTLGWTTKKNEDGAVNVFLKNNFGDQLRQRNVGLQMLITAVHFYSSAFRLSAAKKLAPELRGRFLSDEAVFNALTDASKEITAAYINALKSVMPVSSENKLVQLGDVDSDPIITSRFQRKRKASSETKGRPHKGIDIRATEGTPIYAPSPGIIIEMKSQPGPFAYGNYITIQTSTGVKYRFAHLSAFNNDLRVGQRTPTNEPIGWTGKTGTIHPHLHFEYFPASSAKQADPETDPNVAWKRVFTGSSDSIAIR